MRFILVKMAGPSPTALNPLPDAGEVIATRGLLTY